MKALRRLLIGVVAFLAGGPLGFADDIASRAEQLQEVQQRIRDLQQELNKDEGTRDDLLSGLRQLEHQISDLVKQIRSTERGIQDQQLKLEELETERADTRQRLGAHAAALKSQIRSAYAMGRQERMKLLLNQQDPAIANRMLLYYGYLNQARARRIDDLNQDLARLSTVEEFIRVETGRLLELRARRQADKEHFDRSREEREELIAGLSEAIREKGSKLSELKQDEQRLHRLLVRLQQALADIPVDAGEEKPFAERKGSMSWPVKGPVTVPFGARPQGAPRWEGVLLSAAEGQPVSAVHPGRVAFADWLRGFGLLLIIDHGDGYMSLYGYNQALLKETGEWVEAGDTVAMVGDSGGRSESGLYFGIRFNGKPLNPSRWCRRG